jgi:glycosyltransferase involved in cell wall biosynthesis
MSTPPRVSLLIPVYNPRFLGECLDSAIAQTYEPIEIIVADDSDGTDIANIVAERSSVRLRYVRNAVRRGFHGNFTQLFQWASGRYVKFLNDDDVLHPNCVAQMVAAFEFLGSRVSLVTSRRQRIDAAGTAIADTAATTPLSVRDCTFDGRRFGNHLLLRSVNLVGEPSATMFRRDDVAPIGDTLFRIVERDYTCLADLALWLRLLARGSLAYLAGTLSFIRMHPGQLQESEEVGARCITERYYLPRDARTIGFLEDEREYRAAVNHGIGLVRKELSGAKAAGKARGILEATWRQIALDGEMRMS